MFIFCGVVFTAVLGILLHYTFEWSGRNLLVAFFAPTNESYFEHLKLLLTPFLLWMLVEYVYYGQYMHAFVPAKVISLYVGMFLMVALHLAYTSIAKAPVVWGSILVFIVTVIAAFVLSEFLMTLAVLDSAGLEILFDGILVLTIIGFAALTIYPPRGWLFQSPGRQA